MYSPASLGNILIVDSDKTVTDMLALNFRSEGYSVKTVPATADVTPGVLEDTHIILVDAAGQQPDGLELIRQLKSAPATSSVGIIYFSDFRSERTLIDALDAGADDSIRKPFSLREMLARVRAVMRRRRRDSAPASAGIIKFKTLTVDLQRREAHVAGEPAGLSNTEFAILALLLRNNGTYTPRVEIFKAVWPDGTGANERIVDTNISRLRRKLGTLGSCIVNRSGLGYMIAE